MEITKVIWQRFIKLKTKQKERKNVNMKNRKMNNKGFSLVELIIVIAIMAVLVGVLAPAYLRYVEKSKKSADVQAIDAVMSAMEAAVIDPSLNLSTGDKMEVTISQSSDLDVVATITSTSSADKTKVETELKTTLGEYKLKGTWGSKTSIKITGTVATESVTFTSTEQTEIGEYSSDLAAQFN